MLSERMYSGEALLSPANGSLSFDAITVAASQTILAGSPIARIMTAATVANAAGAGNTAGSGAMTMASPAFNGKAKLGVYKVVCIEPASNAGKFAVYDPFGVVVGIATVAVAFDGEIKFTIADATDFVSGDYFDVTVSAVTHQWKLWAPAGTDGTEIAGGIAWEAITTGVGETALINAITRSAEVKDAAVQWASATSGQKIAARAQLAAAGIIVRT